MATNFPTSLDTLINPQSTDSVQLVSHAAQHANANDAIEALQSKVGINNSTDTNSIDYKLAQLLGYALNYEQAQDAAAALLAHANHTNLIATYDDALNEIRLSVAAPDVAKTVYQTAVNQGATTLNKGTPVYINGSVGASGKLTVTAASNASETTSSKTFGLLAENIIAGAEGQIITEGLLTNVNTIGGNDGDAVWLGTNGQKLYGLSNKPVAPAHLVFLGIVVRGQHQNNGSIFVKIQNGFELKEIHDVLIQNPQNLNALVWNSTTSLWENYDLTQFLATKTYVDTAVSNLATSTSQALTSHESDTTNIHGIPDTSLLATKSYTDNAVSTAVSGLLNSAPEALDTLKELATALGNHANFSTTITNALATKATITSLNDGLALKPDITALTHSLHDGVAVTYDSQNNKVVFNVEEPIKVDIAPPSNAAEGDSWYEADTGILYVYDGTYWIEISGGNGTAGAVPASVAYLGNVTSDIQAQLNSKSPINNPSFTGNVILPSTTSIGNVSSTELSYLDGVTSSIQTQLNNKVSINSPGFTGNPTAPTQPANTNNTTLATTAYADAAAQAVAATLLDSAPTALNTLKELATALNNDPNYATTITSALATKLSTSVAASTYASIASPIFTGIVTLPSTTSIGNVNNTEISYLDGATSNIQTQLNNKLNSSSFTAVNLTGHTYSSVAALPSASANTGKRFYVSADTYTYYSDGSTWIKLAKYSDVSTGGTSLAINDLSDVDTQTTAPQTNQVLRFNGAQWVPGTVSSGASAINDLSDVDTATSAPTNGQTLTWNGTNWVPSTVATVLPQYPAITVLDVTNNGATSYQFNNQYSGDNPTIYAISGTTIAFNLNVTGHPFLIRTSALANYNTGLIHVATDGTVSTGSNAQGKTSGTLYWQIPATTTGGYRYQCSIHSGMVGTITIKDIATI